MNAELDHHFDQVELISSQINVFKAQFGLSYQTRKVGKGRKLAAISALLPYQISYVRRTVAEEGLIPVLLESIIISYLCFHL